jgi:hypothetical protein
MGTATEALRGNPGDIKVLVLNRNDKELKVETKVKHFL